MVKQRYVTISMNPQTVKLIKKSHKTFEPKMSLVNYCQEIIEFYIRKHCPECGCELKTRECSCKAPERL